MQYVLAAVLNLLSLLTFLPLIKYEHWIIRIWDYPRKQLLVTHTLLLLAVFLFIKNGNIYLYSSSILSILATIFLLFRIYPYTALYSKQIKNTTSANADCLSILISNVEMQNTEFSKLEKLINKEKADLVMLLETDKKWQTNLKSIEENYPYLQHLPLDNTYGMLIYSKLKFHKPEFRHLVNEEIPSFKAQIELPSKRLVHFLGLHPEPPFPTQSETTVERDAEILKAGKEVRELNDPVIVAGDLNDVAWSFTTRLFQKLSGLLDPRIGRGFFSTFHARRFWARWPLDHIFISKHFTVNEIKRLSYVGSDHFPIKIEVCLKPRNKNESTDSIDKDDQEVIKEKINQA